MDTQHNSAHRKQGGPVHTQPSWTVQDVKLAIICLQALLGVDAIIALGQKLMRRV